MARIDRVILPWRLWYMPSRDSSSALSQAVKVRVGGWSGRPLARLLEVVAVPVGAMREWPPLWARRTHGQERTEEGMFRCNPYRWRGYRNTASLRPGVEIHHR